jgi:hypothetical protein
MVKLRIELALGASRCGTDLLDGPKARRPRQSPQSAFSQLISGIGRPPTPR